MSQSSPRSEDAQKKAAAEKALDFVRDGMRLGLGTGSTADHFVRGLAERVRQGLRVVGVPTSKATERLALELAIPLTDLTTGDLDLTVDGADEIDGKHNLTKGGGAALLREKIVASATRKYVIVAHAAKRVAALGPFPTPIEVIPFAEALLQRRLQALGASAEVRKGKDGRVLVTDEGHHILDARFGTIADPTALARTLSQMPGVVEHGLFVDMRPTLIIASDAGIEVVEPS